MSQQKCMSFSRYSYFMVHSAVWSYLLIQKQNKNSKQLTEEKLSENRLSRYTKFGRAHLNQQEKIRHLLIWHFIRDFQI